MGWRSFVRSGRGRPRYRTDRAGERGNGKATHRLPRPWGSERSQFLGRAPPRCGGVAVASHRTPISRQRQHTDPSAAEPKGRLGVTSGVGSCAGGEARGGRGTECEWRGGRLKRNTGSLGTGARRAGTDAALPRRGGPSDELRAFGKPPHSDTTARHAATRRTIGRIGPIGHVNWARPTRHCNEGAALEHPLTYPPLKLRPGARRL
jgi:hypothetical protein